MGRVAWLAVLSAILLLIGLNGEIYEAQYSSLSLGILSLLLLWRKEGARGQVFLPAYLFVTLLSLLFLFLPLSPLYSLLVPFLLLSVAEYYFGRQSWVIYLLVLFASTAFSHAFQVFGFPIRLWLSETAASLLSWADASTHAQGNGIYWKGHLFWVDQACIGLKMGATGMLLCLAIAGYQAKEKGLFWHPAALALLIPLILGMIVWSNLARLLSIVVLQVPAGTLSHELLGILSLFLYALLPLYFLSAFLLSRFPRWVATTRRQLSLSVSPIWLWIPLAAILVRIGMGVDAKGRDEAVEPPARIRQGLEAVPLGGGVWKAVDSGGALWYFKGPLKFYRSAHSPMVCWTGSGYTLEKIRLEGDKYIGTLEKGRGEELETRWWYQDTDGRIFTRQWDWRGQDLMGRQIWLMNKTQMPQKAKGRILENPALGQ